VASQFDDSRKSTGFTAADLAKKAGGFMRARPQVKVVIVRQKRPLKPARYGRH